MTAARHLAIAPTEAQVLREEIYEIGRQIDRRLGNIVTFCRHQLTNAAAEGLNSKIMAITR